jgi:hypothetical protein
MKIQLTLILMLLACVCSAQNEFRHNLDKLVSMNVKQEKVGDVLNKVSKAGDFYFSYNNSLFRQDSMVNLQVKEAPLRDVLDKLFDGKVDYKESGEYVILRYAAGRLTIEPENITTAENLYLISGYIIDTETGKRVGQASVYEKQLLQSTLTDDDGYFRLRFKGEHNSVILTASKEYYKDTSLVFLSDIKVRPEGYSNRDSEFISSLFSSIENSGISRFFISSRQRFQSLNIPDFFANSPFQASLIPGISSHGIMSSQVVNKASLNVFGGYTAGVDGIELAGLFNITKGDVKKFQAAGLFNTVGGSVEGVQLAGLLNDVRKGLSGVQAAGLVNHVKEDAQGVQLAGLGNIVSRNTRGTQAAGLANIVSRSMDGIQLAGLLNFTSQKQRGIQIAGLVNYAKEMTGMQFGLINVSGTNTGYSIGLINYSHHGYHKVSLSTNEIFNTNAAFKMGNAKLYNILFVGRNYSDTERLETIGFGFGHDFLFSNMVSIAGEISSQYVYIGNWDYANFMNRFQANLQIQVFKGLTLFGGPVYSVYTSEAPEGSAAKGYKQQVAPAKHRAYTSDIKGWWGWNAGITLF